MYLIEIPNQPLALEQIGKSRSERYLVLRFVLILRIDPIASNVLDWLHLEFKFPKDGQRWNVVNCCRICIETFYCGYGGRL